MKTKEKSVEQYLRAEVEARGGDCIKIDPANNKGFPDRLVLLPGGVAALVEAKKPSGGRVSEHQEAWAQRLLSMGFTHRYIWSREDAARFIETYDKENADA